MVCANAPVYILQNTPAGSRHLEILIAIYKLQRDPTNEREIFVMFFLIHLNMHTYFSIHVYIIHYIDVYTLYIIWLFESDAVSLKLSRGSLFSMENQLSIAKAYRKRMFWIQSFGYYNEKSKYVERKEFSHQDNNDVTISLTCWLYTLKLIFYLSWNPFFKYVCAPRFL